mgnify:CR=1 FL=1
MQDHRDSTQAPGTPGSTVELVDRLPADIARRTMERLQADTDARVSVGDVDDTRVALANEQRSEADQSIPSLGVITPSQARGAVVHAVLWGLAGAVLGVLVALIPIAGLDFGLRIGLFAIIGFLGGSSAGALFGGGRQPELEGDVRDAGHEVTVKVSTTGAAERERAEAILAEADLEAASRAHDHAAEDSHHARDAMDS